MNQEIIVDLVALPLVVVVNLLHPATSDNTLARRAQTGRDCLRQGPQSVGEGLLVGDEDDAAGYMQLADVTAY